MLRITAHWASLLCLCHCMCHCLCFAGAAGAAQPRVDFDRDVWPILEKHCAECHGSETQESKLRLDSMVAALRGGDSGEPSVIPGSSERSHLIERITSHDPKTRMPPDQEQLSDQEVTVLRSWIDDASLWTDAQKALSQSVTEHWSFQPLRRPAPPTASAAQPIDAFVNFKLAESGLEMSGRADRRKLIRRLFLVMHGLPPTPEQVDEFEEDQRPDAWLRQVDRILSSPHYGQRWATHWLDIVHFGETNGFETNRERPHAYRFRDWVIEAFNNDQPYDQFVQQQIAGDALGQPIATGFLVAGPNDIVKGQDALLGLMQRQDELTDMVNTVGTAFLGLTTGCARCHNHKFDPITQTDFYAMQAVFAGVEHGDRELPPSREAASRVRDIEAEMSALRGQLGQVAGKKMIRESVSPRQNVEAIAPTEARFVRFTILSTNASEPCLDELEIFCGDQNVALASAGAVARSSGDFVHPLHKLEHINDGRYGNAHSWIASSRAGGWVEVELSKPCTIDRITWGRDRNGKFTDRLATEYRIETSVDRQQWQQVASSDGRLPLGKGEPGSEAYDLTALPEAQAVVARGWVERLGQLAREKAALLSAGKAYAGNFRAPKETHRLHRGDPTAPREEVRPGAIEILGRLELEADAGDQARRVAMAHWIARADNPLTARVIVNRLWQFHFGTGIVDTPSDFGANGTLPTHPELLDWLACELIGSGWSLKHIHRLILTSQTWQQDSRGRAAGLEVDAASRLLWRFPPRRLEAEGIRDCVLAASGALDLAIGGPGFSAFEVEFENVRHYFPKKQFGPADWRRMIYMTKVRQEKDSIFGLFDCPDGSQVTPKRSRSTTPLQALNLLNSHFINQQADLLAERLMREAEAPAERIVRAFEVCFGRKPDAAEAADASAFTEQHGWSQFARALLNANEFVFVP